MTNPWVPQENVNAGKMYDRIEARMKALEAAAVPQARQLIGTGTQSIPNNTPTILTGWSTTPPLPYNSGSISYAAGVYTVGLAGIYQWEVSFTAPAIAAAYLRTIRAFINGVDGILGAQENVPANNNTQGITRSGSVVLNANDTIAVRYTQATGAAQIVTPLAFTLTKTA